MRKAPFILSFALLLFLFSCQKEITFDTPGTTTGTGGTGQLIGTWKFVNVHAVTFSSNQSIIAGVNQRTETTSEYTSIDNSGTIVFAAQTFSNMNVGYRVDTWSFNKLFENGVLIDTFTMPMQLTIPPTSSTGNYTMVGADSITTQSGTTTSGAKLRFSNDTLFMKQRIDESSIQNMGGVMVTTVRKADVMSILKKQ